MSTGLKVFIGLVLFFMVVVVGPVMFVFSAKFTANEYETAIKFSDKEHQNVYSNMNKTMKASGLTVENYGDTTIKAIEASMKRYADKPELMAQFVVEKPTNVDSAVWTKFMDSYKQDTIAIQNAQTSRLSKSEAYETWLGSTLKGNVAGMIFNYPTPKIKETMDKVISTKSAQEVFKTSTDTDVDVFGESK